MMSTAYATATTRLEQARHWNRDQSHRRQPDHPVIREIYQARSCFVAGLVSNVSEPSVLDVGCGGGVMTHYLRQRSFHHVCGVDFSHAMLCANREPDRICADAQRLPFPNEAFDVVTASQLLHHMTPIDRLSAVTEFGRVASRWVVLYEPNRNNPAMFLTDGCRRSDI